MCQDAPHNGTLLLLAVRLARSALYTDKHNMHLIYSSYSLSVLASNTMKRVVNYAIAYSKIHSCK